MEQRLFDEGTVPEFTKPEWYAGRESAPHIDQPGHRPRLELAAAMLRNIYKPNMTVSDLGCGDGGFLSLISNVVPEDCKWGYDLQMTNVIVGKENRLQDVRYADLLNDKIDYGTISVSTEVIEHLIDPHAYVKSLASKSKYLIASSPYTETVHSHYEFHTWVWDCAGYYSMFENNGWQPLKHDVTGMFQVILLQSKVIQ